MIEPMDDDFLIEWSRERQAKAYAQQWSPQRCKCGHPFHGVVCSLAGPTQECDCPSSEWEASA